MPTTENVINITVLALSGHNFHLFLYMTSCCYLMSYKINKFNIHGPVHRKNILIYIQQDATLHSLLYLETALHVSGGTSTHHQECKQLYLLHLVFVRPLLLPAAITAGSSLTDTRGSRYSCSCSWWWEVVPPETCTAVSR